MTRLTHEMSVPFMQGGGWATDFECRITFDYTAGTNARYSITYGWLPGDDEQIDVVDIEIEVEVSKIVAGKTKRVKEWVKPDDYLYGILALWLQSNTNALEVHAHEVADEEAAAHADYLYDRKRDEMLLEAGR